MTTPLSLLLIDPGPERKKALLEEFSRLPVELYVIAATSDRWGETLMPPGRILYCDVTDAQRVLEASRLFEVQFDGAGTYFEPSVLSAAYTCEKLGLRGPSLKAVESSSISKTKMRQTLLTHKIATPRFSSFTNLDDLPARAEQIGYPCVLKPASGADSQSVRKIENRQDAHALVQQNADLMRFREGTTWINHDRHWIVEEYLEGPLLAVDGYVSDHKITYVGSAEMELGPEPYFNLEVNWIPPRLPDKIIASARQEAAQIINAIGLNNSSFHAEFRITAAGPRLVEIAARLAGGVMPQGYKQAHGFNVARTLADLWLGRPLGMRTQPSRTRHVLQKGVFPREPGILTEFCCAQALRDRPEVFEFSQIAQIGEPITLYPEASIPIYFYGLVADSHEKLVAASRDLEASISWTTAQEA